jgi:uncharacterized membrane protein
VSIVWWELTFRVGPNLWVVPLLMAAATVVVFILTRRLDSVVEPPSATGVTWIPEWLLARTPADADVVLSALLAALATAMALVFSTSGLTFSLASSQLGPRPIRRFMQDPVTQVTLGAFLSAVILCILTLGSVRNGAGPAGVPEVSYAVSVTSGIGCFILLIFYVHRVASSIQAPNVVASVVADLDRAVDERHAMLELLHDDVDPGLIQALLERSEESGGVIPVRTTGYVQAVDHVRLVQEAERLDATVVLARRPGQFVVTGQPLARVLPGSATAAVDASTHEAVEIGPSRTRRQDIEFATFQVVEIALRALSPAINDTFTGLTCVDWLAAALCRLGTEADPSGALCDGGSTLRVYVPPLQFDRTVAGAFDLIRQAGAHNPAVVIRLLDRLADIAVVVRPEFLPCLRDQADLVLDGSVAAAPVGGDADVIAARHRHVLSVIQARQDSGADADGGHT